MGSGWEQHQQQYSYPSYDHYHHQHHHQYHHSHDCQNTHHQHKYHKIHPYLQYEGDQQYLHGYHNGSAITIPHLLIVDLLHIADMDQSYGTYVDDVYLDNHDYDDTDDDTDDDNDHKKDNYTAAGAAPTQTRPGHARPGRAKPDPKSTLCLACVGMNGLQISRGKLLI